MKKFKVGIPRTETAEHEGIAEEIASDRYNEEDYDSKDIVWAEDGLTDVKEVTT
jgi:hypothetical protein